MYGKILTCFFTAFLVSGIAEAKDQGFISGRVTWEGGYGFISAAKVYIYGPAREVTDSTITNRKGIFSIAVTAGEYYVSAEKNNLVKEYFPNVYLAREAAAISVTPGQNVIINFALDSGGWVSGTFSCEGSGVEFTLVTAIKIDQPEAGWYKSLELGGPFPSAYAIQGLLPGTYKILGRARGRSTEYFPGVQNLGDATPISVVKDIGISDIDFMLEQVGWGCIEGRVFSQATNEGIANVPLYAYQWHDFWQDPNLIQIRSSLDGNYLLHVPAGDYFVFSMYNGPDGNPVALYYDNSFDPTSADIIHVSAGGIVPGVNFAIDNSITHDLSISGTVTDQASGNGLGDVIITAIDRDTGEPVGSACSVHDGQFSIGDLAPGRYLLMFSGTYIIPYFYPQAQNWQDAEVIELQSHIGDVRTEAITQDYGNNGLMIAGAVRSTGPLVGARIYAYRQGENDPIAYARTDAAGNYAIVSGLTPGYYMVTCDLYGYNHQTWPVPVYLDFMSNPESSDINFTLEGIYTAVADNNIYDGRFQVSGNYPNPFNSRTLIRLYSGKSGEITSKLSVFNLLGQMVGDKVIQVKPGDNLIEWNSTDFRGSVSSGTYFYRFDGFGETYRMILLK